MNAKKPKGMIFAFLIIPFLLNDFSNFLFESYPHWVVVDYSLRFLVIGFVFYCIFKGKLEWDDVGLGPFRKDLVLASTLILGMIVFIYSLLSYLNMPAFLDIGLSNIPYDRHSKLFIYDKYFGLVLVAFSEELIARGLALSAFKEMGFSKFQTVLLSAALFSIIHWSLSIQTWIDAFILGALFMITTIATRSIIPSTIIHYLINVIQMR